MRAHQIMTRQVITVATGAPIVEAANTMLQNHISGLPVVDETGKLVGIIYTRRFYPPRGDRDPTKARSLAETPSRAGKGCIGFRARTRPQGGGDDDS